MTDDDVLAKLLSNVFDHQRRGELPELAHTEDYNTWKELFVFHFTDWISDVDELHRFFKKPAEYDIESASLLVGRCLTHIVPHINAAARLLLDEDELSDPFADHGVSKDGAPPESVGE